MHTNHATTRIGLTSVVALLALPAVLHGCSKPTEPARPPAGGQQIALSFAEFEQSVEPVLIQHGCDAVADCHGGGIRGTLELSPPGAKNAQFDFDQVKLQVLPSNLDASPILTEPLALAAGGTPHGVKPFATTSDSGYLAIRQWLHDGVLQ